MSHLMSCDACGKILSIGEKFVTQQLVAVLKPIPPKMNTSGYIIMVYSLIKIVPVDF